MRRIARDVLGYDRLLPGQAEAARAIVGGRDTLALLPTGGGKSAIYQVAGIERAGPTIVVSPLIALQEDQLAAMSDLGLAARAINSTRPADEREEALRAFAAGQTEFLLLSPEQLADEGVLEVLAAARPSLFVVDEAHCISEWGHDFRPEYRRLGAVSEALGRPPILALTATASPAVREEIVRWLRLREPAVVARGFDRPNIELGVDTFADGDAKRAALVEWVAGRDGAGIVYTATRRGTTDTTAALRAAGVDAAAYHAGMSTRRRTEVQTAFMDDRTRVIVATIAFGMGVDKSDVRFVAHLDVSDGLDAYHQEIGRAGRDGEPASAVLFYRPEDLALRRFQGAPGPVESGDVKAVLRVLSRRTGRTVEGVAELARLARRSRRRTEDVVARLEELGALEVSPAGPIRLAAEPVEADELDAGELGVAAVEAQERRRRLARSRVDMIRGYAETDDCRRRFLLNYFGEEFEAPCGRCDNCRRGFVSRSGEATRTDRGGFRLGDAVRHVSFGTGTVTRIEDDRIIVLFEDGGQGTLDLDTALGSDLLAREP